MIVPRCENATRNSFDVLGPKTLFSQAPDRMLVIRDALCQTRRRDLTVAGIFRGVTEQVPADDGVVRVELVIDPRTRLVVVELD